MIKCMVCACERVCVLTSRDEGLMDLKLSLFVFWRLINRFRLTWCKPPGSEGQVHYPRSLLAAMTTPALCQTQPWQQAEWGEMAACTYLKKEKEIKCIQSYFNCGINNSISCTTDSYYSHILTMWRGADVSGHAGSALPCPAIRSNTDSVLRVNLQLTNVHVLEGHSYGATG